MKRILSVILALLILVSLSACSSAQGEKLTLDQRFDKEVEAYVRNEVQNSAGHMITGPITVGFYQRAIINEHKIAYMGTITVIYNTDAKETGTVKFGVVALYDPATDRFSFSNFEVSAQ